MLLEVKLTIPTAALPPTVCQGQPCKVRRWLPQQREAYVATLQSNPHLERAICSAQQSAVQASSDELMHAISHATDACQMRQCVPIKLQVPQAQRAPWFEQCVCILNGVCALRRADPPRVSCRF